MKLSFFFPSENVAPSWIYDSAALPVASVPVLPPGRRKCRCSPPDLKTLPYILRVCPFLYQFLYSRFLCRISLHSMIGQGSKVQLLGCMLVTSSWVDLLKFQPRGTAVWVLAGHSVNCMQSVSRAGLWRRASRKLGKQQNVRTCLR